MSKSFFVISLSKMSTGLHRSWNSTQNHDCQCFRFRNIKIVLTFCFRKAFEQGIIEWVPQTNKTPGQLKKKSVEIFFNFCETFSIALVFKALILPSNGKIFV